MSEQGYLNLGVEENTSSSTFLEKYQEFCAKGVCGATRAIGEAFEKATKKKEALGVSFALGLSGETGEVVDILKKYFTHDRPLDYEHLKEELGDLLWYLTNIANVFNIDLEEIIQYNMNKLKRRYPDAYKN